MRTVKSKVAKVSMRLSHKQQIPEISIRCQEEDGTVRWVSMNFSKKPFAYGTETTCQAEITANRLRSILGADDKTPVADLLPRLNELVGKTVHIDLETEVDEDSGLPGEDVASFRFAGEPERSSISVADFAKLIA